MASTIARPMRDGAQPWPALVAQTVRRRLDRLQAAVVERLHLVCGRQDGIHLLLVAADEGRVIGSDEALVADLVHSLAQLGTIVGPGEFQAFGDHERRIPGIRYARRDFEIGRRVDAVGELRLYRVKRGLSLGGKRAVPVEGAGD